MQTNHILIIHGKFNIEGQKTSFRYFITEPSSMPVVKECYLLPLSSVSEPIYPSQFMGYLLMFWTTNSLPQQVFGLSSCLVMWTNSTRKDPELCRQEVARQLWVWTMSPREPWFLLGISNSWIRFEESAMTGPSEPGMIGGCSPPPP